MNEDHLNRIIITRREIDMKEIQSEYEKISKYTLYDQIQVLNFFSFWVGCGFDILETMASRFLVSIAAD